MRKRPTPKPLENNPQEVNVPVHQLALPDYMELPSDQPLKPPLENLVGKGGQDP